MMRNPFGKISRRSARRVMAGLLIAGVPASVVSTVSTISTVSSVSTVSTVSTGGQNGEPQAPSASGVRVVRPFHVEEATIADVHRAIQLGQTTCAGIVQSYIDRARAYNGTCVRLVTRDGSSVPAVVGPARGGSAVSF